jgi:hypothetical protein
MASPRRHHPRLQTERIRGGCDPPADLRIETSGTDPANRIDREVKSEPFAYRPGGFADPVEEALEATLIGISALEPQPRQPGNGASSARPAFYRAKVKPDIWIGQGLDLIEGRYDELGGSAEGISPHSGGSLPGVIPTTMERDILPGNGSDLVDNTDRYPETVEDRPLFDVKLKVSGNLARLASGTHDFVWIESCGAKCIVHVAAVR